MSEDDSSPDVNEDFAIDKEDAKASSLSQEKQSRFATSGEHLDFNFEAYDQDICILGSKGSGSHILPMKY